MNQRRRLLELLADSNEGCSEDLLRAHGFKLDNMVDVVNAGLATATTERGLAGGKPVEFARVRITEAGRRALLEGRR
jgi:hypothetical protein